MSVTRESYLAARVRAAPLELWHVIDAWPLYVGLGNLARTLVLQRAVQAAAAVPGDFVEFGTWRGATLLLWAKLLAISEPHSSRRVHGFDRWADGFEHAQWIADKDNAAVADRYVGEYRGDLAVLREMLTLYALGDRVVLYQGALEQTWPIARQSIPRVALALLDVDLYAPTLAALEGLHERLAPGAIVLADEYGHPDWPGETAAVDEWLDRHPGAYRLCAVPDATQPTLWIERR